MTVILFSLGITLMLLAPLALIARGLLRQKPPVTDDIRERENIALAKKRLAEANAGGAGDDTLTEHHNEIKRQLLADTGASSAAERSDAQPDTQPDTQSDKKTTRACLLFCAALLPALSLPLYALYGAPEMVTAQNDAPQNNALSAAGISDADLQQAATRLQQRLAEDARDYEALALMASAQMALQRPAAAAEFYARAAAERPDLPQPLIGQIQALIAASAAGDVANENNGRQTVEQLLDKGLALFPDEPYLLWFAGARAEHRGDYETALSHWYRVLAMTDEPQAVQEIQNAISKAEQKIAGQPADAPENTTDATDAADTAEVFVRVEVNISEELKRQVNPDDTVFIFARAQSGAPTPLAAQRARAADLPLTITLSAGMAMLPNHTLADFSAYNIIARISKTGDPRPTPGDPYGEHPATPGETVTVTINQLTGD